MSISGQQGVFAWAMQSAKGSPVSTPGSFYRHKATQVDFGPQQADGSFPPEVGGNILATGAYKSMAFVAGGATINPRLSGSYGHLLKAAAGSYISSVGGILDANAVTEAAATGTDSNGFRTLINETVTLTPNVTIPTNAKVVVTIYATKAITGTATMTITDGAAGTEVIDLDALVTAPGVYVARGSTTLASGIASIGITGVPADAGRYEVGFYDGAVSPTLREHLFRMAVGNSSTLPWVTVRSVVPGPSTAEFLGTEGQDCRVGGLSLTMPQNGIINSRVDFVGRVPRLVIDPYNDAGENWDNGWAAPETYESVPLSCVIEGGVVIPAFSASELPLTSFTLNIANNMTTPQQEIVIGSYHPDDFTPLSRAVTVNGTIKWNNSDLYRLLYTNSLSGKTWSPITWTSPLDVKAFSPGNVSTTILAQWGLRFYAPVVRWSVRNPPQLAGGELVQLQLQGEVLESPASDDSFSLYLTNAQNGTYYA